MNNPINILSTCPLCEQRALHVVSAREQALSQCLSCGYATAPKFEGSVESCDEYDKLPSDMKKMAKEHNNSVWIPSVMTLPMGMLTPVLVDENMFWSFQPRVDIPEDERKNYPIPDKSGQYYEQRYDASQTKLFLEFHTAMGELNKEYQREEEYSQQIKLPKLKKINE